MATDVKRTREYYKEIYISTVAAKIIAGLEKKLAKYESKSTQKAQAEPTFKAVTGLLPSERTKKPTKKATKKTARVAKPRAPRKPEACCNEYSPPFNCGC